MQHQLFETSFLKGGNAEWMDPDDPKFPVNKLPLSCLYRLNGGWGHMDFLHIPGDGYDIFNNKYHLTRRIISFTRIGQESFELSIIIKANGAIELAHGMSAELKSMQCQLSYAPYTECKASFSQRLVGESLDFYFSLDYLLAYSELYPEVLEPLLEAFHQKKHYSTANFFPFMNKRVADLVLKVRSIVHQRDARPAAHFKALDYYVSRILEEVLLMMTRLKWPHLSLPQKKLLTDMDGNLLHYFGQLDPSIEDFCRRIKLPSHYLREVIRERFNMSPKSYLFEQRLKYARKLLADPTLSLTIITQMLHYTSIQGFFHAFKHLYGITPTDYRVDRVKRNRCNSRFL